MNNNEANTNLLMSIQKTAQQLLNTTKNEIEVSSSSLSSSYSDTLLRSVMCLERQLFLGIEYLDTTDSSFWITAIKRADPIDAIGIWAEPSQVTIRLPYLPHRYTGNQDLVAQLLAAKLHMCSDLPHWRTWHAEFIHLYPVVCREIPRDVDNYSYKKVIDVIAFHLRASDDARHFDMSMTTVYSDDYEPGVYIQITPSTIEDRPLPSPIARKDQR